MFRFFLIRRKFFGAYKWKIFVLFYIIEAQLLIDFWEHFSIYLTIYRNFDNNIEKLGFSNSIETALKIFVESMIEKDGNLIILSMLVRNFF